MVSYTRSYNGCRGSVGMVGKSVKCQLFEMETQSGNFPSAQRETSRTWKKPALVLEFKP